MNLEERRRQLGIVETPKQRVGALGPASDEERLEAERKRLAAIQRAGCDPAGKETERRIMRRMGRR